MELILETTTINPIIIVGVVEDGMITIGLSRYGPKNDRERKRFPYSYELGLKIAQRRAVVQPYTRVQFLREEGADIDEVFRIICDTITRNIETTSNPKVKTNRLKVVI